MILNFSWNFINLRVVCNYTPSITNSPKVLLGKNENAPISPYVPKNLLLYLYQMIVHNLQQS